MLIQIYNQIQIDKKSLSNKNILFSKKIGSISNPIFYKNQKMRISNYQISRILQIYEEDDDCIYLPIGLRKTFKCI